MAIIFEADAGGSTWQTGAVARAWGASVPLRVRATGTDVIRSCSIDNPATSHGAVTTQSALSVSISGGVATATLTLPSMPGTLTSDDGGAYRLRARVNAGLESETDVFVIVGVVNAAGIVPLCYGETGDRSATHGYVEALNDAMASQSALSDGEVSTAKLADEAVTEAKLAGDAVTTTKIADGAVTADKMANDSVATANIVAAAVTSAKLATGAALRAAGRVTYSGGVPALDSGALGVASIADTATGVVTVTLSSAVANANKMIVNVMVEDTDDGMAVVDVTSTTVFVVRTSGSLGALSELKFRFSVMVWP